MAFGKNIGGAKPRENKNENTVKNSHQKETASNKKQNVEKPSSYNNQSIRNIPAQAEEYYKMGSTYEYREDLEAAYREYLKAAKLGHPKAMYNVASDYVEDNNDSILGYDLSQAEFWARKAIENGEPDGYDVLSDIYIEHEEWQKSLNALEEGVRKGSLLCRQNLAELYYFGDEDYGIAQDVERTFQILSSAEWEGQFRSAYYILGDLYNYKQLIAQAKEYFEKAIRFTRKDSWALSWANCDLGQILVFNDTFRDYTRGKNLLTLSANQGNTKAMDLLGVMYDNGIGVAQDKNLGRIWFQKSAEGGWTNAMVNLFKVTKDTERDTAMYWLNKAAQEGDETAIQIKAELDTQDRARQHTPHNSYSYSHNYDNNKRERIKKRVMRIVEDKLGLDRGEAQTYNTLENDLGADSLDAVELIMEMEKEFDITVPDHDAQNIRTVGDIVSYIERHT